jgi:hypothetical protein
MTTKPEYIEVDEASGKNTVTLKRTYGGVSQIVMREPTVQDLLTADMQVKNGSNAEKEVMMFANLCEVTPEFIKDLGVGSYERLQESYRLFTS